MKAVSGIIIIIIMLLMSVSLAGLAYMFITTTATSSMESGTEIIEHTTSSVLSRMKIDSIADNIIYIRNIGSVDLTNFSLFVNNRNVNFLAPDSIAPGEIGNITVYDIISKGDDIKVTSSRGTIALEKAPDPCDNPNVILCFKLDGSAIDSSRYRSDGTLTNSPSWVNGISGQALYFNGNNQYVSGTSSVPYDNNGLTIELWINKTQSQACCKHPIALGDGHKATLYFSGSNLVLKFSGLGAEYSIATGLAMNEWVHAVVTYNGTQLVSYVNGVETTSQGRVGGIGFTNNNFKIGAYYSASTFIGVVDEVRVYNKAIY